MGLGEPKAIAVGILPEFSKLYCHPARAWGSLYPFSSVFLAVTGGRKGKQGDSSEIRSGVLFPPWWYESAFIADHLATLPEILWDR
jgi:hypothetical protein